MGFFDFFKKNKIKDSVEVIDRKSLSNRIYSAS